MYRYFNRIKASLNTVKAISSKQNRCFSIKDKYSMKINQLVSNEQKEEAEAIPMNDEIFETQEQRIGVELLNTRKTSEIYDIYEKYKENEEPLGLNGLVMMLYFIFKSEDLILDVRLLNMMEEMTDSNQDLDGDMLVSLMYGLSQLPTKNLQVQHALVGPSPLGDKVKHYLAKQINNQYLTMNTNNCLVMAVGINAVFQDFKDAHTLMNNVLEVFVQHLDSVQTPYILKMVQEIAQLDSESCRVHLSQLAKCVMRRSDELDFRMLCFGIDSFEMAGWTEKGFYTVMAEGLIRVDSNEDVNALARAACCLGSTIGSRKDLLRGVLKMVYKQARHINNQGFMDLWMCLGRCGGAGQAQGLFGGKTIELLKRVALGQVGQVQVTRLADWEVANLLLTCAVLRLDDPPLVGILVNLLFDNLAQLDTSELVHLGRSFVVYVKQYEQFYIRVHDQLNIRLKYLSVQDIDALRQSFGRCSLLFPYSPFTTPKH